MNLEPFTGPGSTPSRRRFWDKVTQAVIACQKVEGDNVTVAEHQGAGTLININRVRGREGGVGACCYDDGTCDDLTEADCNDAEGNWQGPGTTCADDPNPCVGACCEGEGGTTCVEDSTPDSCAEDGGTFQDFGSTCDPNPCPLPPCCEGAFEAFDGSGRMFLKREYVRDGLFTQHRSGPFPCVEVTIDASVSQTDTQEFSGMDCDFTEDSTASSSCHTTGFVSNIDCDSSTDTSCWDSNFGGPSGFYLFCSDCDGFGEAYTDSGLVTDSATMQHRYQNGTGPSCTNGYENETWILSEECTP